MATTWIKPIHTNQARGATQTVKDSVDYVTNPEKTDDGRLVSGYSCELGSVEDDFAFTRSEYQETTGRNQESEILAYHVRHAFKPGEIDAETANKLGHELAQELTGGKNAYIVATHIDKEHIHNHIIICAHNLDAEGKFVNPLHSYKELRAMSDRICEAHNLSVVENPSHSNARKDKFRYETPPRRDTLVSLIDSALASGQVKSFEDLLQHLETNGCKIKRRGKTISVKPPDAKRFFRFRTGDKAMPEGYDEESLRKKIEELQTGDLDNQRNEEEPQQAESHDEAPISAEPEQEQESHKKINLLIDIENSLKAQDSPGYRYWASQFNLQQAAETLLFLQINNLTNYDTLSATAADAKTNLANIQERIVAIDTRMKEITTLQKHIGAYRKGRDIYSQYMRSNRNKDFYAQHQSVIDSCDAAKEYFNSLGSETLPSIKDLQTEWATLAAEKNQCYATRKELRPFAQSLENAKQNADALLGKDKVEHQQDKKSKQEQEL